MRFARFTAPWALAFVIPSSLPSRRARKNADASTKAAFVLDEYYESLAGVARHWQDAMQNWQDLGAVVASSEKATVATLHSGTVVQALW